MYSAISRTKKTCPAEGRKTKEYLPRFSTDKATNQPSTASETEQYMEKYDTWLIQHRKVRRRCIRVPLWWRACACRTRRCLDLQRLWAYRKKYIVEHEKPSFREPPKEVCFYAYKRINHFREILAQFQAKETTTQIPEHVIESIKLQVKKERMRLVRSYKPENQRYPEKAWLQQVL